MHDSCSPLSNPVRQGDAWLARVLGGDTVVAGGLAAWAQAHDTLILVTFDESVPTDTQTCCPHRATGGGGHVGLWVIGPPAKVRQGGFRWDGQANLFWLFRSIEQNWGFPLLGHAADAGVGDLGPLLPTSRRSCWRRRRRRPCAPAPRPCAPASGRVGGSGYPPGAAVRVFLDCAAPPCAGAPRATLAASARRRDRAAACRSPAAVVAGRHRLAAAAGSGVRDDARPGRAARSRRRRPRRRSSCASPCAARCASAASSRATPPRAAPRGRASRGSATATRSRAAGGAASSPPTVAARSSAPSSRPGRAASRRRAARRGCLSSARCVVPALAGLRIARALRRLRAAGCAPVVLRGPASGRVRRTTPLAGVALADGRPVAIVARRA